MILITSQVLILRSLFSLISNKIYELGSSYPLCDAVRGTFGRKYFGFPVS
jgi:hypothetical protein